MAYKDPEVKKQKAREYQQQNREMILEKKREYNQRNKERIQEYHQKNKDKIAERKREHYQNNKEKRAEYLQQNREKRLELAREYYHENKDKIAAYRQQNRDKINERARANHRNNIQARLAHNFRRRIQQALNGAAKSAATMELIGCTTAELKQHLEAQFTGAMTWENWTSDGWHIDHIRPCASFDLTDPAQQRKCFNYQNLQPLWAEENKSKGAKYEKGGNK